MVRATMNPQAGPIRTCIGCRDRTAKSELLRVVVGQGSDGRQAVTPDPSATAPGRGAHVHPTTQCHELAVRRRAFSRALRAKEGLGSELLREYLAALTAPSTDQVINRPEIGAGSS